MCIRVCGVGGGGGRRRTTLIGMLIEGETLVLDT